MQDTECLAGWGAGSLENWGPPSQYPQHPASEEACEERDEEWPWKQSESQGEQCGPKFPPFNFQMISWVRIHWYNERLVTSAPLRPHGL